MAASNKKVDEDLGYDLQVISHQPETSNAKLLYPSPPLEYIEVPEVVNIRRGGICYLLCMCCYILLYIALCPLSIIATMIYPCVSLKGRKRFMQCIQCLYMKCCCAFDCVTPLSLYDAMSRYEENPLPDVKNLIPSIVRNRFMISILETLNESFPDYFFSFLPSGSQREGFARILPSSSILASDYDIMLILDAMCVSKNTVKSGEERKSYKQKETPAFRICSSPTDHPDGYMWLKLDNSYLIQWERICLRRQYKNEGASFLSSQMLLRDVVSSSSK